MRYLIAVIFALFFATQAAFSITPPPAGNTKSFCNGTIIVPASDTSYFCIRAYRIASSTNGVAKFFRAGVQYQVPADKNFQAECLTYSTDTANSNFQLISATSAALDAGLLYESGATSQYVWPATAAITAYHYGLLQRFDENVYPGIQGETTPIHRVLLCGKEITDPVP